MDVPSYAFIGFAAAAALAVNLAPGTAGRRAVLLVANLAFLVSFAPDPRELGPFAALLVLGWLSIVLVRRTKRRAAFALALLVLLVAFCALKRYAFVPPALFPAFAYVTVGMSYVFFRVLHLVIDAYQDALPNRIGLLDYANYTLNFPCLVAGPIQLYPEYHRAEIDPAPLGGRTARDGFERIVLGSCKVLIVAPPLGALQAWAVAALAASPPPLARAADAALMTAVYPVFLYANFAGYTDIVIGVARFLRLPLPENFDHPFATTGFLDFWNRWHITLANWVKTYVYSPLLLASMRRFPDRRVEPYLGVFAYFVAFFVVGVWHGTSWSFVFLGVLLGFGVSANKLYQLLMVRRLGRARYAALCRAPLYVTASRALTLAYFAFCSLWFWSSWAQLGRFAELLGAGGFALAALLLVLGTAALACAGGALAGLRSVAPLAGLRGPYARTALYAVLAALVVSVTTVLNAPAPQIVYRAF